MHEHRIVSGRPGPVHTKWASETPKEREPSVNCHSRLPPFSNLPGHCVTGSFKFCSPQEVANCVPDAHSISKHLSENHLRASRRHCIALCRVISAMNRRQTVSTWQIRRARNLGACGRLSSQQARGQSVRLIFVGLNGFARRAGTLALRGGPPVLFVEPAPDPIGGRASSHDFLPRPEQAV